MSSTNTPSYCLFCSIPAERVVAENHLAYAIGDGFPVTPLHTLIIPKRHVLDFFGLTKAELLARNELLQALKASIEQREPWSTLPHCGSGKTRPLGRPRPSHSASGDELQPPTYYRAFVSTGPRDPETGGPAAMNDDEYQRLLKLSDRDLFDFTTESPASQRMWAAQHLLELRRNQVLAASARSSAAAAWFAAVIAGISAAVAVLSYLSK